MPRNLKKLQSSDSWLECSCIMRLNHCFACRHDILCSRLEGEDARKLDRMFNRNNCLIEVNPGKILLPPEYEELADRIRGMKVHPDDVWLASYPRTGEFKSQVAKSISTMNERLMV